MDPRPAARKGQRRCTAVAQALAVGVRGSTHAHARSSGPSCCRSTPRAEAAAAGGAAAVGVSLSLNGGLQFSAPAAFTYHPRLSVASLSPKLGPMEGGSMVTVTGANFGAGLSAEGGASSLVCRFGRSVHAGVSALTKAATDALLASSRT